MRIGLEDCVTDEHRSTALQFPYNDDISGLVKTIPDRKWSASDKSTPYTEDAMQKLNKQFEAKPEEHFSRRVTQRIFEGAVQKAGVKKKATVHTLRHSFATHLLEHGTDLRYIQELLGHKSSKTTEIHTHITDAGLRSISSLLDGLIPKEDGK